MLQTEATLCNVQGASTVLYAALSQRYWRTAMHCTCMLARWCSPLNWPRTECWHNIYGKPVRELLGFEKTLSALHLVIGRGLLGAII